MTRKRIRVYNYDTHTFIGEFHFDDDVTVPNIVEHGTWFFKLHDKGYIRIERPVYVPLMWNKP